VNHAQRRRLPSLADVKRLYVTEQLSSTAIAARYGCHPQSIRHMLKGSGVPIRGKQEAALLSPSEWTDERVALLKELWAKDLPVSYIHKQLGVSYGLRAVSMKAQAIGLPRRANPVKAKPKPVEQHKRDERRLPPFPERPLTTFLPESPRLEMAWRVELAKVRAQRAAAWRTICGVTR